AKIGQSNIICKVFLGQDNFPVQGASLYISIGLHLAPDFGCTVPPSRYAPYSDIEKKVMPSW
ncbi:hypothetical protein, partial [Bacteroides uniformis]|uniref:hypothetical protein n=1 Tax=Bacteroides uniformis TaxID=820 RepID=UPI000ED84672